MKKIILVDSCCNLPTSFYHENEDILHMISMPVNLDDKIFLDDHGKTISNKDFYDALRNGVVPSTSQISPSDFYNKFKELYENNNEILYIAFSSGMSGTYNNSVLARQMFLEDYPDSKITIVDSFCASVGYGVLVLKSVEMLRKNHFNLIPSYIEENKFNVNHIFTVNDFIFLKKGGRIPPALATIGTLLNIKPIMTMDTDGKLNQSEKIRGKKKVYKSFLTSIKNNYNPNLSPIIIGHGNCEEEAIVLKEMINSELGYNNVIISEESPTIGSHVGPGLIVVGFIGNHR